MMKKKDIAEAIYLFSRIEKLLREYGGTGESFSDLVKSFNQYLAQEPQFKADKARADTIGYKFYWNSDFGGYMIKDTYIYDDGIEEELEWYETVKERYSSYMQYKRGLIGGFYNNLRSIGYERNNLMHKYNYTIENFPRFKKACFQVIDYLERGKTPMNIINLHDNGSVRNRLTFMPLDYLSTWIKFFIALPIVYWFVFHYDLCSTCPEAVRYGIVVLGGYLFFSLLYLSFDFLAFAFRSEENMQGVVVLAMIIGGIYFYFSHTNGQSSTHLSEQHSIKKSACQYYYVVAKSLNIRTNASIAAYKKGKLHRSERVCIDETRRGWAHLRNKDGWVALRYLSKKSSDLIPKSNIRKKQITHVSHKQSIHSANKSRKKKQAIVWHCIAKAKRASGWVERLGLENAKKGALYQCEIRRQENEPCRIVSCYKK
jgi:hypothetical protein